MRYLFIILLFVPLLVFSQKGNTQGEIFCTVDYNGKQMIRVKWLYNSIYEPKGFDLYRQKEGSGNWVKVNSQPIVPNKNLSASSKLDNECKDFHKALVQTPFDSLKSNPVRIFFLIKSIYVNELAEIFGIAYNDEGVSNGETYIYKLTLTGQTEAITQSRPIKMQSYQKVGSPADLKSKRSKKHIDFNWKPDIYSYYAVDVYRKKVDETDFVKITKLPRAIQADEARKYSAEKSVFYQDTSIKYDDNYIYKFKAIDYFGQESEFTEEISVPAVDLIPPEAPFNLNPIASSLNGFVRLEYQLVDEPDLVGANVYESPNPEKVEFKKVNSSVIPKGQLNFVHSNLSVGGHYYLVTSVDIAGNENRSDVVFTEVRDITPPEKPKGLSSESGEGFITLKWNANTESDLAGYHIERAIKKDSEKNGSYVSITKDPIKVLTFTEKLARNVKNEFVYRIVAVDTNFNRSKPSENTLAKMPDVVGPMQPLIKSVACDTVTAVITWLPNVDLDLQGYNVYRRLFSDSLSLEKINFSLVPKTVSSYTDRSLKAGTSYEYLIEAVDEADNKSPRSLPYFAKTNQAELTGKISIESKKINTKKATITIEWKLENKNDIKGFVVYAKNDKGLYKPASGLLVENKAVIKTEGNNYTEFYIKAYTKDGRFIESDKFSITEQ